MKPDTIFHISEDDSITIFKPRPSPSFYAAIKGDVVFGIDGKLLHNYLLPRECPRVTYYATEKTSEQDKRIFLNSAAQYVIIIEASWIPVIQQTRLYCYSFDPEGFSLLDACAGYYISYEAVKPLEVIRIDNILLALANRQNMELRIVPGLEIIANSIIHSSLNYSLIRMRNASGIKGK